MMVVVVVVKMMTMVNVMCDGGDSNANQIF